MSNLRKMGGGRTNQFHLPATSANVSLFVELWI
jgi:hypothetical protein